MRKVLITLTTLLVLGIGVYAVSNSLMATSETKANTAGSASVLVNDPLPACEPFDERPNRTISAINSPALNFNGTDIDGNAFDLNAALAKGPVLLEFFASWCPHCQHSVPGVKQLIAEYPEQLSVVAINAGDRKGEPSTSKAFQKEYKITYPLLENVDENLFHHYCLAGFPTFYLIDQSGAIVWRFIGTLDGLPLEALKGKIDSLVPAEAEETVTTE